MYFGCSGTLDDRRCRPVVSLGASGSDVRSTNTRSVRSTNPRTGRSPGTTSSTSRKSRAYVRALPSWHCLHTAWMTSCAVAFGETRTVVMPRAWGTTMIWRTTRFADTPVPSSSAAGESWMGCAATGIVSACALRAAFAAGGGALGTYGRAHTANSFSPKRPTTKVRSIAG